MNDATADADFLSLLQEIEVADAPQSSLDGDLNVALFDDLLTEADNHRPDTTAATGVPRGSPPPRITSHVERCRLNRKRKKQELDGLREAAATLEATLATLTQRASSATGASHDAFVEYRKSVAENTKLRDMVRQHVVAAQQIQKTIRAVPAIEPPSALALSASHECSLKRLRGGPKSLASSWKLYDELFDNIHSTYERTNLVEELAWLKIGVRKISMEMVTEGSGTELSIRVMECQRLPFNMAYVKDATWKHLSTPCMLSSSQSSNLSGESSMTNNGDDMYGECGAECRPVAGTDALPPGRLAIRRYVEPNRLTFVWECDGCFQCDSASQPIGRVTERGWCTVEPSQDNEATTVFRIQVQYIPHSSDVQGQESCSSRPSLSSDTALELYRKTLARTFGAVEREVFKDRKCTVKPRCC